MLADLPVTDEDTGVRRPQHTARVTLGLTRICLGGTMPEDSSQCVAAAGLDHRVAILPGVEAGSNADVERNVEGKGSRRLFYQSCVYYNWKVERGKKDLRIGIDEDGNVIRFNRSRQLIWLYEMRCYPFHAVPTFVDRFGKGNGATHCERLLQFGDDQFQARPV